MCGNGCWSDVCLVMLSVLFPPLPVWIRRGFCSCDSLINVCLFILGYFPGLIHSWYIIAKYPPYSDIYYIYRSDLEHQTPRRIIVQCDHDSIQSQPGTYGAVDDTIRTTPRGSLQSQTNIGNLQGQDSNPPPYSEFGAKWYWTEWLIIE
jgi:uncharacterized membrane protein YqaE (UPF0057 family)